MMDYMRNGGITMWVMLIAAIAIAVIAATRPAGARSGVLSAGCALMLILGMFGLSSGLMAISTHYQQFPDKLAAIGEGLGELANNGTFSAGLALLFGVAAIATKPRPAALTAAKVRERVTA